jgi:hypothetical protein
MIICTSYPPSPPPPPHTGLVSALAQSHTASIPESFSISFLRVCVFSRRAARVVPVFVLYTSAEKARLVSVSISVMTGVLASAGRVTRLTAFLTSSRTSLIFALVFAVIDILENQSEEFDSILSIHLMSLISLYILSVTRVSISTGLVPGYAVDIAIIPSLIEGLDSFGRLIMESIPMIMRTNTTR